ncbi:MAG: hexapeptide repeat-containing transferase [uncultured bacterium]|nr:MAG: hexapeptide repeat-containing transferase [uncultured bacterium]
MKKNTEYLTKEELLSLNLATCGENVLISRLAKIAHPEKLRIGNHVRVDDYCLLIGDITIGNYIHIAPFSILSGHNIIQLDDFCSISARVSLYSAIDDYSGEHLINPTVPEKFKKAERGKIHLEKHVVLGVGTTVLPNVVIGEGVAVGAHSLVVLPLKPWGIYFGSPAKLLKARKRDILQMEQALINNHES